MKKIIKGIGIVLFVGFVSFSLYTYKLRSLSLEYRNLFEHRCLYVNLPLIAYKKAFLKFADFVNTYPNNHYTSEEFNNFLDDYIEHMRMYVEKETIWLNIQRDFMNRWDYQLLEPWYMKQLIFYQSKVYEGYRDDAKSILSLIDNPESAYSNFMRGDINEERKRRDFYIKIYDDFMNNEFRKIRDWRKFFVTVPSPRGCVKENTEVPNTSGSIDWNRDLNATPSSIPIDLDLPSV